MIEFNSRIVASPQQISTEIPNETVILNLADGLYYGLDEVGAFVWTCLQTPHTVEEIIDALTHEYDVERDRANRDILNLLSDLQEKGLIVAMP